MNDAFASKLTLLLAVTVALILDVSGQPKWSDCGADDALVSFGSLDIDPYPIKIPGEAKVKTNVQFTNSVRNLTIITDIKKQVMGFWITVPCYNDNLGSCEIKLCERWSDYCKILPGAREVSLKRIVPRLDARMKALAVGKAFATIKIYDVIDGQKTLLGCLETEIELI